MKRMSAGKELSWKKELKACLLRLVGVQNHDELRGNMIQAYTTLSKVVTNCVKNRKQKRAVILRKFLKKYLFLSNSAKNDLQRRESADEREHPLCYVKLISIFLTYFINVTLLSRDINKAEKCSEISTHLFLILDSSLLHLVESVLNADINLFTENLPQCLPIYRKIMVKAASQINTPLYLRCIVLSRQWQALYTPYNKWDVIDLLKKIPTESVSLVLLKKKMKHCCINYIKDKNRMPEILLKRLSISACRLLLKSFSKRLESDLASAVLKRDFQLYSKDKDIRSLPGLFFLDTKADANVVPDFSEGNACDEEMIDSGVRADLANEKVHDELNAMIADLDVDVPNASKKKLKLKKKTSKTPADKDDGEEDSFVEEMKKRTVSASKLQCEVPKKDRRKPVAAVECIIASDEMKSASSMGPHKKVVREVERSAFVNSVSGSSDEVDSDFAESGTESENLKLSSETDSESSHHLKDSPHYAASRSIANDSKSNEMASSPYHDSEDVVGKFVNGESEEHNGLEYSTPVDGEEDADAMECIAGGEDAALSESSPDTDVDDDEIVRKVKRKSSVNYISESSDEKDSDSDLAENEAEPENSEVDSETDSEILELLDPEYAAPRSAAKVLKDDKIALPQSQDANDLVDKFFDAEAEDDNRLENSMSVDSEEEADVIECIAGGEDAALNERSSDTDDDEEEIVQNVKRKSFLSCVLESSDEKDSDSELLEDSLKYAAPRSAAKVLKDDKIALPQSKDAHDLVDTFFDAEAEEDNRLEDSLLTDDEDLEFINDDTSESADVESEMDAIASEKLPAAQCDSGLSPFPLVPRLETNRWKSPNPSTDASKEAESPSRCSLNSKSPILQSPRHSNAASPAFLDPHVPFVNVVRLSPEVIADIFKNQSPCLGEATVERGIKSKENDGTRGEDNVRSPRRTRSRMAAMLLTPTTPTVRSICSGTKTAKKKLDLVSGSAPRQLGNKRVRVAATEPRKARKAAVDLGIASGKHVWTEAKNPSQHKSPLKRTTPTLPRGLKTGYSLRSQVSKKNAV